MEYLENMIREKGEVRPGGIVKVDSFLNHMLDYELYREMGKEFKRLFGDAGVNKILTVEASGIGIACVTAQFFEVPVLFAKKNRTSNIDGELYSASVHSFTHGNDYKMVVSKKYLLPTDRVLIIDDFLANGQAMLGMLSLVEQARACVCGCGVAVEKAFQPGGELIRAKGVRVEALAKIKSADENSIVFC